jgi:hypothetical protein
MIAEPPSRRKPVNVTLFLTVSLWRIWRTTRTGSSTNTTDQRKQISCRDWSQTFRVFDPDGSSTSNSGKGNPAGNYNDITQFVYFVVRDLHPSGKTEEVQHAFDLMEHWLTNGNKGVQELVVIGFLEDLQNLANPAAFIASLLSRLEINMPRPAPSAIRVPVQTIISGKVMFLSIMAPPWRKQEFSCFGCGHTTSGWRRNDPISYGCSTRSMSAQASLSLICSGLLLLQRRHVRG